ncbi:MAG: hypothetical protein KDG89_12015 [Geminicoccaceae bacterium]|nr:hypothetical protein [Geminicoccaceae bacterium]
MADEREKCFVIGPIGQEGSPERRHADMLLNLVIKEVLEKDPFSYCVVRADEVAEPGSITSHVIRDVMQSPLACADLTFLNPNVFYELGIRHAAKMPTIHLAQEGTNLPFDSINQRTIFADFNSWEGIKAARKKLKEFVETTKQIDYKIINPVVESQAIYALSQSNNPLVDTIISIKERLSDLERSSKKYSNVRILSAKFDGNSIENFSDEEAKTVRENLEINRKSREAREKAKIALMKLGEKGNY